MAKIRKILTLSLLLFCCFSLVNCTSSDDDTSVLEAELDDIESDQLGDEDVDDLDEIADDDLVDEVDEGDDLIDEEEEALAGLDKELEEELDLEDEELDDDEVDEDDEGSQIASDDEIEDDELDEFDEFDEFDDEESEKQVAQNENSLEEELNQKPVDYPVTQEGEPQFPEEVIAMNQTPQDPNMVNPAGAQPIVSETQEITAVAPAEQLPQDDLGIADPILPEDDDGPVEAQSWVPVVKIKTDPFIRNSRMMNAVYIARPKDSMGSISDKIFGNDKIAELKADNPHLKKGIDPGDKVYYNSPNRPEDNTQVKVFYDDIGLKPQYYTTKSGDNMRRLGSKLLGFPDGWKEVWAINANIDSKTILPGGVEVKYWTGNEQNANMELAQTTVEEITPDPIEQAEPIEAPVDAPAVGTIEEFPEDLPPEPPLPDAEIAMPENDLEPEMIPDIEPFPEQGIEPTPTPVITQVQDQNESLIQIGGIALLLMAGLALVAIQIKKRKDTTGLHPQSMEYTQV